MYSENKITYVKFFSRTYVVGENNCVFLYMRSQYAREEAKATNLHPHILISHRQEFTQQSI